jgi:hypothetical protein
MKTFLSYTAIVEGFTGVLLLLIPIRVFLILFNAPLEGNAAIVAAMLAGAAILTLAIAAWILKKDATAGDGVKAMLVYNLLVTILLLYGALHFEFKSAALWGIIIFHTIQTFISTILLILKK